MVSVVIPLYNKQESIEHTINSVLNQSYRDFELIVVNDGSTDNSDAIVSQLAKLDDRVKLVRQQNLGVSAARNKGIMKAQNDLVALIDGDDIWDSNCLLELVQLTIDFPLAALYGVNYADMIGNKIIPYTQGVPVGYRGYYSDYFKRSHGDLFCSSSVILRKDIAMKVGLFDERIAYAEDIDFWYRMIRAAPICFYNKVYAYYNKGAENRVEKDINAHFEIHKRMEYYIDKYVLDFREAPSFARYVGLQVAQNILFGGYYFGGEEDRKATDHIKQYLPYKELPFKYSLIFKLPRWMGNLVYRLNLLVIRYKK